LGRSNCCEGLGSAKGSGVTLYRGFACGTCGLSSESEETAALLGFGCITGLSIGTVQYIASGSDEEI